MAKMEDGDWTFKFKRERGTSMCERRPIDDPHAPPERILSPHELPEGIRQSFEAYLKDPKPL
jgi:hypothetical protein